MELTQDEVKRLFHYDPDTGTVTRILSSSNRTRVGAVAGSKHKNSTSGKTYLNICINWKTYSLHRVVWLYVYGFLPANIDHIDGNGCNNSLKNLRNVSFNENHKNKKLPSNSGTGFCGVSYLKKNKKWMSKININKKCIYLGCFSTISDAIEARKAANVKYGFHKNHGSNRPL